MKQCEGCPHPQHYGRTCPEPGCYSARLGEPCRYGAMLVRRVGQRSEGIVQSGMEGEEIMSWIYFPEATKAEAAVGHGRRQAQGGIAVLMDADGLRLYPVKASNGTLGAVSIAVPRECIPALIAKLSEHVQPEPAPEPCSPGCPGWGHFNADDDPKIQRCDECKRYRDDSAAKYAHDVECGCTFEYTGKVGNPKFSMW